MLSLSELFVELQKKMDALIICDVDIATELGPVITQCDTEFCLPFEIFCSGNVSNIKVLFHNAFCYNIFALVVVSF